MAKPKRAKLQTNGAALTDNPFAAAFGGLSPSTPDVPEAAPEPAAPHRDEALVFGPRAIVRRQKKGQGGKTVACVEGLPPATASALLPKLKRELGCSGRVDAEMLILGTRDHARVAAWLTEAGAPRVTLGN
ncbi:MAG: translation initiation factor [Myxococcota bacterium]